MIYHSYVQRSDLFGFIDAYRKRRTVGLLLHQRILAGIGARLVYRKPEIRFN